MTKTTIKIGSVEITPANFLTPEDDATILNVSFASSIAEKHALGVGFAAGILLVMLAALGVDSTLATLGVGGTSIAVIVYRARRILKKSGHVKDALKEPANAGLGAFCGVVMGTGLVTYLQALAAV